MCLYHKESASGTDRGRERERYLERTERRERWIEKEIKAEREEEISEIRDSSER